MSLESLLCFSMVVVLLLQPWAFVFLLLLFLFLLLSISFCRFFLLCYSVIGCCSVHITDYLIFFLMFINTLELLWISYYDPDTTDFAAAAAFFFDLCFCLFFLVLPLVLLVVVVCNFVKVLKYCLLSPFIIIFVIS